MSSISHFSIKRSVTTTLIIVVMVLAGLLGMKNMSSQLMPDFDIPVSLINIVWVGASPEDVDKLITTEVEEAIKGIEGIKTVNGYSSQNAASIVVNFDYGTDVDEKVREIQTKVNNIKNTLPKDIQEPVISKIDINASPIIIYNMFGSDLVELYRIADEVIKPSLEKITGVAQVNISGGLEEEIRIETTPERLSAYSLNISSLRGILAASNINMPLGNLMEGDKEFVVKVRGEIETIEQIKNIVVSNTEGKIVKISDVADVKLSIKDIESYARQNGKESVRIEIVKTKEGNTVKIAENIIALMNKTKNNLPENIDFILAQDNSVQINQSISSVYNNALTGIILASIVLLIFLKNIRATLVVAIAIPISVIFTFALLFVKGITLNIISLMGLALGVGMLVDNSIVVIDNIYRHLNELKEDKNTASANGASEMAIPIIASTATTVAVFLPIVVKQGMAREIFHDLSYSITFALLSSLIIALTFVPMAAAKFLDPKKSITNEGRFLIKLKSIYSKVLDKALKHKKMVFFIALVTLVVTVVMSAMTLKTEFMPQMDSGQYNISGTLAKGLDVEKANKIALELESIVKDDKFTIDYSVSVNSQDVIVNVKVPEKKDRKEDLEYIISGVREKIKNIPDVKLVVSRASMGGGGSGGGVELKLYGNDLNMLKAFSEQVLEKIKAEDGLVDVKSSYSGGNPELILDIDREKAQLYGLKVSDIATFISYQVKGTEAFTIKSGGSDVDVTVRLKEDYRNSIDKILDLDIASSFGNVKLKEFASLSIEEGASTIQKEDGQTVISITANPDDIDLGTATNKMKASVESLEVPRGVSYGFGGNQEQFQEVMSDLFFAIIVGVLLIYFIIAAQFESFTLPLIIMGSVPLSIIGVLIGLVLTGTKFDVMVMVGIIMLAGIVVNNAIVLIDYINVLREKNYSIEEAIREAGATRLRPIIMTTATTVFGMLPLAFGIGQGSEMYRGMAIAVSFGLTFSTLLTLILIPILYAVEENIRVKFHKRFRLKYQSSIYKEEK